MKIDWTASQLKAIRSSSRDVCVVAAAGSGKTGVLVERFAHWVSLGVDPASLIAITYTRSAGEQLKEKILRRLVELGRPGSALSGVGTIHGFCARLLQENAIDAGLDPAFSVLEGEALAVFEARAFAEWMESLQDLPAAGLALILGDIKLEDFRRDLRAVYARWRSMGRPEGPFPGQVRPERVRALWTELLELLKSCRQISEAAGRTDFAGVTTVVSENAPLEERLLWLGRVRDAAIAFKKPKAQAEAGSELLEAAGELADTWADLESEPFTRAFTALLADFDRFYARRKREESLLDPEDLLEEALALFSKEAFAVRFRNFYKGLLVDEYQDVNDLQSRLLAKMGEGLNVFTVGDARQSIYRFRYAECRHLIDRSKPAPGRERVDLVQNFRSRSDVLGWINAVLSEIEYHEDLPFGELVATRPAEGGPAVELLLERPAEKMLRDDASRAQARRIADRIAEGTADGAFRPGDVAVLFRRMKHARVLEEELRARGIRFHSQRKRGFWDQIEVQDQLSLLYLLRNPAESYWAAAVLRSPWAGLDDDLLYRVFGTDGDGERDWKDALESETGAQARHFAGWFDRLAKTAGSLPVRRLLSEALAASGYAARTLAAPDGAARLANVRKLIELAAEAERLAGGGLTDFLRHAEELEDEQADRGEAALAGEKTDAVRILTVHSAKGLEFPVVFVWGLDQESQDRDDGRFVLTQNAHVARKFRHDLPIRLDPSGAAYAAHRAEEKERDDRESRRLFYVALTRARERLVLCGTLQPPSKSGSPSGAERFGWLEAVREKIPGLRDAAAGPVGNGPASFWLRDTSAPAGTATPRSGAAAATVPHTAPLGCFDDRSRPYRQTLDLAVTAVTGHPNPDKQEMPVELLWETDSGDGEWADIAEAGPETGIGPSAPAEFLMEASAFGTLLHEVLQHVALERDPAQAVDAAIAPLRHRADAAAVARVREEALRFLNSPIGTELRRSAAGGRSVFREAPFLYRVRRGKEELGFLRGQVDLLFEAPDSKWVLVDYKTSAAHRPEYDEQTRFYAHGLRNLLGGRPHRAVLFYTGSGESRDVDLEQTGTEAFEAELLKRYSEAMQGRLASSAVGPSPCSLYIGKKTY